MSLLEQRDMDIKEARKTQLRLRVSVAQMMVNITTKVRQHLVIAAVCECLIWQGHISESPSAYLLPACSLHLPLSFSIPHTFLFPTLCFRVTSDQ